jgi:selenocysteine lyase/cysteine desulfurase
MDFFSYFCRTEDSSIPAFGQEIRARYFLQHPELKNLNHGSFGAVPKMVAARQYELMKEAESFPDKWFREDIYEKTAESRKYVSDLIGARVEDVVLVENASTAVNGIIRNMNLKKGDKVLRMDTAYNMVIETFNYLQETIGIEQVIVPITFPIASKGDILASLTQTIKKHNNIKVAVLSHISSMPAITEPVEDIVALLREKYKDGCKILIDGAHAPGILDIDIQKLNCDYYTGNLHKWCFTPKACAFLWVRKEFQKYSDLQPTVISSTGHTDYVLRFAYTGTKDYTAFCSIPAAFTFIESLGGHKQIYKYNHDLVMKAAEICVKEWNTSMIAPPEMSGVMCCVLLPFHDDDKIELLHKQLIEEHRLFFVYKKWKVGGKDQYIVRISAQCYNSLDEYIFFANFVKKMM